MKIAAILLFALLTGLSGTGNLGAFGPEEHCSHAVSAKQHAAAVAQHVHPECGHSATHAPNSCAMNGMCSAAGCFLALALNSPAQWAGVQALRFHPAVMLNVDELAHPPPLEPPRA